MTNQTLVVDQTPIDVAPTGGGFQVDQQNRALANGIYLAISFLLQAAAIWVVGSLADSTSLTTAFAASALLALVSIPAVFWLPARRTAVG